MGSGKVLCARHKKGKVMELNGFIISCACLALLYGVYASRQVFASQTGNARMVEIASDIPEGANAYLNRQ